MTDDDAGTAPATPRRWIRYVCPVPANLAPGVCGQPLPCDIHDIPDPDIGHIMWGNTYVVQKVDPA
jgi:hypothetical protein